MSAILFVTMTLSAALAAEVYGEVMPPGESVSIAAALGAGATGGEPRKYEGRITKVCQTKGCWLILEEDGRWARVMTRHAFFVPKDASGRAVVFGELSEVAVDEEQARHLAADGGGGEPVLREFRILARSIQIRN